MKRSVFAFLLWAAAIAAFAQPAGKLGVGDNIRVTVFQQPDLTTEARISESGTIAMPLAGEVKVAGLAPIDAAGRIAKALKDGKFLRDPQVSVAVVTVRSQQVNVLGMVARPGRYALDDTSTLVADVIAAAGGITPEGAERVTLLREGKSQMLPVMAKNVRLRNGDTIYVDRAPVFYIYGEVSRSGAYRLEPGMTVMQAIAAGGGITPRGSDRRLKMRRTGADGKVVETDAHLQDVVKANDVIYVREALF